jgi:hypothetical protein
VSLLSITLKTRYVNSSPLSIIIDRDSINYYTTNYWRCQDTRQFLYTLVCFYAKMEIDCQGGPIHFEGEGAVSWH